MKITICGSMYHIAAIQATADSLRAMEYEVETPDVSESNSTYQNLPADKRAVMKRSLIQEHLDKISGSDAVLIYNDIKHDVEGYLGGNTLMEMAFAFTQRLEIFLWKPVPDMSYADEIAGMQLIVIDGQVKAIDDYFKQLPVTLLSSDSPIKLRAISRGMRRAGIRTRVIPKPTASGVSEQPQGTEETYQGARNRHAALKEAMAAEAMSAGYLATIEGGICKPFPERNAFGSTVVMLEEVGGDCRVGCSIEVEYPRAMTDKVPAVYPDLGVLAQQEYGSKLKDPFPFMTNGLVNRQQLVEAAVFNVASQL